MQEKILQDLRNIGEAITLDLSTISPDANLYEEGGLDSLDMLSLIQAAEDKFSVSKLDTQIESILSLRDLAIRIEAKIGQRS